MTNVHIVEQNFDSGFRGDYEGYHIDTRLITRPNISSPIFLKLNNYLSFSPFFNVIRLAMELFDSIEYLNMIIEKNFQDNYRIRMSDGVIHNLFFLNFQKEQIVHIMKKIIDDLIMILCNYHDSDNIRAHSEICISSIGELKTKKKYSNKDKICSNLVLSIKSDLNYDKYKLIFDVINDLHNAYKHSCLINISHGEFNPSGVSLSAYYAKYNRFDTIYYLNHNLMHVVIGFSDFLTEFFDIEVSARQHSLWENDKYINV